MHYAWLGSLAGHQKLSVEASHWILENRYGHTPEKGLDGNDDSGTLSAWYLFASMGFYPIAGTEVYALGAPIFNRVEIDQSNGDVWTVQAPEGGWNQMPRWMWSGDQLVLKTTLTHQELLQGLTFAYESD
jgi:putative alpha-1,2-mannosidase